ncbi:hypothetical protein AX16_006909 [Volvariella volvacea WC 439]|nr:hypothetical protein AX16_006909 [Volvariella volvacea WC 439]
MLGAPRLALFGSLFALTNAVQVYLSPRNPSLWGELNPEDATVALSQHLGLESFQRLTDLSGANYEEAFVGQGADKVLLLSVDEEDVDAILPASMRQSFALATPSPVPSLVSVISTYLHQARLTYENIYDWRLRDIHTLSNFFEDKAHSAFAGLELSRLAETRQRLGASSEKYTDTVSALRKLLEHAVEEPDTWRVAVLTFNSELPRTHTKREPQQSPLPPNAPPQQPIGSISTCFTTLGACNNGTNTCSGRGQCVEASKSGRTCFVCTCGVTKTGEGNKVKTERWVGQSCERKDVSGPFVLLSGTVLVIFILVFGAVSLLYGVGSAQLPSTLTGTAVNAKRD